ncbi:hypothetical protein GCK72_006077 [Caenorhabditis remanei]|uniref:ShKT domain-containing protein n=1 Tax=Caenorhabditis remanei TaxID=31234 RepID=A0A6A5HGJ0_CAERE|nr:hypothetical protein GCK72_006077 [Caenorhabditis remanei]KAF1766121.1 hypothetical protein GCK72_006077 [Caenorhabditis remanei]
MKKQTNPNQWFTRLLFILFFEKVKSQLEEMSNVGNIVLEQDPRDQDPFYRNYYARAEGMPLAAVNSVVHNVKHKTEGQFKIWHELPSHKVRPGYSTTTRKPKFATTTIPWVRGRHRPQSGQQQAPWYQKFSDPDGYDTGHGTDYDDGSAPPPRPRGRRPPGGRGRRPPSPMAPVRVSVGKGEYLVHNEEGGHFDDGGEGTKAESDDSEGTVRTEEGKKPITVTEKTKIEIALKKEETKKEDGGESDAEEVTKKQERSADEGQKHGEVDLADLKNGGVVHKLRTSGKGKTVEENEKVKEEEKEEVGSKKKKGKKEEEEDEENEEEEKPKTKKKQKGSGKKGKENEDDGDKKKGKHNKKKAKDEEEEDDENGELKNIDGDVRIQKAVDGDTDDHEDEEDEEEEEDNNSKKKHGRKRTKGKKNEEGEEDSEDYDEEDEEEDNDDEDEDGEEESKHTHIKSEIRKSKVPCTTAQRHQNPVQHHQNIPPTQVPYPHSDNHGYTHTTTTTTSTVASQYTGEQMGDDYHEFEKMDCNEKQEEEYDSDEENQLEEKKKQKKKKKSKKNNKKKGKKKKSKKGKGGRRNQLSKDYLTSREKVDQNKRNRGHILDELHADEDLKKLRKDSKPSEPGIDCTTAVDEFPLKCGAWKSAGFCDTNQATQFLWCRKTCLCSITTVSTTGRLPISEE